MGATSAELRNLWLARAFDDRYRSSNPFDLRRERSHCRSRRRSTNQGGPKCRSHHSMVLCNSEPAKGTATNVGDAMTQDLGITHPDQTSNQRRSYGDLAKAMQAKMWRMRLPISFAAIVLTGLALVAPAAHLFELPNKIAMPENDYFVVQEIYNGWSVWLGSFCLQRSSPTWHWRVRREMTRQRAGSRFLLPRWSLRTLSFSSSGPSRQ